jgi:hypothetical protein
MVHHPGGHTNCGIHVAKCSFGKAIEWLLDVSQKMWYMEKLYAGMMVAIGVEVFEN